MIRSDQSHLTFTAATHAGMKGKKNEDRYAVTAFRSGKGHQTPSLLAVVCDGIGGHRAGEVAAEMGVSIITEQIGSGEGRQPLETLDEAIATASAAIYEASQADRGRAGMGATCACAWVIDDRLYTANLGDSRIYLLRGEHFVQLTTDHTWIQEALDVGLITDDENGNHINAHVIRRYLGSSKPPEPDFRLWFFEDEDDQAAVNNQGLRLRRGDILLLCTDGLTDLVSDEEIREVLATEDLANAPEVLIGMANARGGHDNTTVVLLEAPSKAGSILGGKSKRHWTVGCGLGLMLVSLVAAIVLLGSRWREEDVKSSLTPLVGTRTLNGTATQPLPAVLPNQEGTLTPTIRLTDAVEQTDAVEETDALTDGAPGEANGPQATLTPWPTDTRVP